MAIDEAMLEAARAALSELPAERAERFGGARPDATAPSSSRSELSSATTSRRRSPRRSTAAPPPQALANWVTGELVARLEDGEDPARLAPECARAGRARRAGLGQAVSVGAARQVLDRLVADGDEDPPAIVEAEGLAAIDGDDELTRSWRRR